MDNIRERIREIEKRLEMAAEFKDDWKQLALSDVPWLLHALKDGMMIETIRIQFICEACTARLIIKCDESIWTLPHHCEECQAVRTFLRDVVICEDEFHEPIPVSLYLFRAGKRYKIGSSINPTRRLHDFSTSPIPVELVWASQIEDAEKIEKQLHELFKGARCHGEWFYLNQADVEHIKGLEAQHGR